jgi:hypothetical protein
MKNKLTDLNNHLFAQLERLSDEDLEGDKLREEIERSKSVATIAQNIIANGKLLLDAHITIAERMLNKDSLPRMLGIEEK